MTNMRRFFAFIDRFRADESGAATVDWVVGTAVAVTMSIAVTQSVGNAVKEMSDRIAENIANFEICYGSACPAKE